MARACADQFAVPDAEGAMSLDVAIEDLRKDIEFSCSLILQRARAINSTTHGNGPFRLQFWEERINRIRRSQRETFSVRELRQLRRECDTIAQDMEQFSKGLR